MNQRVAVRAIIEQQGKTLVLRRASGRETILGKFELPGGKLAYGEQPEDALRRYLHDDVGLHMETARIDDVVTYLDHDDRDLQYVVIVFRVKLAEGHHDTQLGANYNASRWIGRDEIASGQLTDLTQLLLGIVAQADAVHQADTLAPRPQQDNTIVTLFSDGGSRGNPGPSAAGYVIVDRANQVIDQGGEYLGVTTNNQAEYHAVRLGLERVLELGYLRVEAKIDSMLVVNQMKGVYSIKNRDLWPINERIRELVKKFDKVIFTHVRREYNQLADGMVNKTLDAHEVEMKSKV